MGTFSRLSHFVLLVGVSILMAACAPSGQQEVGMSFGGPDDDNLVSHPPVELHKAEPLLWEEEHPDGKAWSTFAMHLILTEAAQDLLPGSDDIEEFCPAYYKAYKFEKVNFWAFLVSAMAKHESGFDPTSKRASEGMDDVTGKAAAQEGLLQRSYQDSRKYKFCRFDWENDRKLEDNDPRRTILNPETNLECGIKILAQQVGSKRRVVLERGPNWKSLNESEAVQEIQTLTRNLPFCIQ